MARLVIVMPTLNQGQYIERSVRSVVKQLTDDDLFVVVDGGSTDDTQEILGRWSDHIHHIEILAGSSQAQALAWGFKHFPARYAAWLNSDDLYLAGALNTAIKFLNEHPRIGMVYGQRIFVDADDQVSGVWRLPNHLSYLMQRWDYIPQEAAFWRYDLMQQVGGIDDSLGFAVDYDLFLGLMDVAKCARMDVFQSAFREHATSKTQTQNASLGVSEVKLLQAKHGISSYPWDRVVGGLLRRWIEWRSAHMMSDQQVVARLQQGIDALSEPSNDSGASD